jgi:putative transposase
LEELMYDWREEEALFRYGLIAGALDARISNAERGALVRALAGRLHVHPSGDLRQVGRSTVDDWIRAYRRGGFGALLPKQRASVPRTPSVLLDRAETLRRENPRRTCAQIARIIATANGGRGPSRSTIERHLRRLGLSRAELLREREAFGRFEASVPNELWVADCLHGPVVSGKRAILIAVLDDHSRLVIAARFCLAESTVRLEAVLRDAFQSRGLPSRLYCDNGQIFTSRQLGRICAVMGIRLVHSAPGRPQGRGKIERFFRTLRDGLLVELEGASVSLSIAELERILQAWIERVYHQRVHTETGVTPLARYVGFTPRRPTTHELHDAFLWTVERLVTKTAMVSLLGNRYEVHQALRGRRVELRFDPYDLARIEVYYAGRLFGQALAYQVGRHVHPQAQQPADLPRPRSGIDYGRLLSVEHEREWLAGRINYHELAASAAEEGGGRRDADDDDDDDDGVGGVPALVRS